MVEMKRAHAVVALILAIASPCVAGLASYYNAMAQLAPKSEVEKMRDKVDRIAEDVATIKGILQGQQGKH